MRVALGVEYEGSDFRGWQAQQEGVRTVQVCLEKALGKVADHPVAVICAGRTDAGVHATGQVVHFDTEARRSLRSWVLGSNSNLPKDISVVWAQSVPASFHARFSALARRYRYVILNRPFRSALQRQQAAWFHKPLDATRMNAAGRYLLGEHDFTSFRALGCQARHPVRTVYSLEVERRGDLIVLEVEANAFLHHMVRNIAGVLMAIGTGERPLYWVQEVLEVRNRTLGGVTAPPEGLYLINVCYPEEFDLPSASVVGTLIECGFAQP